MIVNFKVSVLILSYGCMAHIAETLKSPCSQSYPNIETIAIEDDAWIGSNVKILPRIIGKRAVVAAGSLVTKNVETNCIYGGNPAKLIKEI